MLKILVPVDDANLSRYAIQHVIHRAWSRDALEIHLIHVQPAVNGYVAWFARSALQDSRAGSSAKAFKAAGKLLDRGGLQYATHESWGDPAHEIVRYAESGRFSGIVMASDGLGSISEMVLGSVTAKVLRTSRVPVEVVPASIRSSLRAYAGPAGLGAGIAALLYAALD
jgi:nucleotide-binding universal stress UspA family protein